jgi:sulfite reductase (NADPH) flavoprotein alpha-component
MENISAGDLAKEKNVLVITSTWGEGDMPDNAVGLWHGLNSNGTSPSLSGVNYAVLSLGDRNYGDTFCLAGKKFDQRLAELGANRLADRVDCDVDYDAVAEKWIDDLLSQLSASLGNSTAVAEIPAAALTTVAVEDEVAEDAWTKKKPFPSTLLTNRLLNAPGSSKETRHIEFSLEGSGLSYEVGDALGVYATNDPDVADAIITAYSFKADESVALPDGGTAPLREALINHYEIRAYYGKKPEKAISTADFVDGLKKLQPRLYSISSSIKAHPHQVHLTVSAVRYEKDGLLHQGVASTFLADRIDVGEKTGIFFHRAPHFRLPADPNTPVIMVGPGTGIAPFRAFLEERHALGAKGRNWLFFGDQHEKTDFLYREQLESYLRSGLLSRLDTAFSRDQERKVYVQSRMLTNAMELFRWLEEGAHFYVCGDASRMAKDVDAALHTILETVGGRDKDGAAEYISALKKAKRYQRDVY